MTQKTHRICVKLRDRTVHAAGLKILRKYFPDQPLSAWKAKVQNGAYLYCSDDAKYGFEGKKLAASLAHDLECSGLPTQLYEEWKQENGWKTVPITKDLLCNLLRSSQTVARQIAEEMESEAEE